MNEQLSGQRHGAGAGSFAMGLICGAAVGAAVGLLLAPKSGVELRRQIATSTDRLRQRAATTVDRTAAVVDDAVQRSKDALQHGRETFDQIVSAARPDGRGHHV
jgi:gas vesicle protein